MFPDFTFEKKYWQEGKWIIGVDEVGRGCIAGPLTLGGYVLPPLSDQDCSVMSAQGIHDSKKLSEKRRENIFSFLNQEPTRCHTSSIDVAHINKYGIMHAWRTAIVKLHDTIKKVYPDSTFVLLVDGLQVEEIPYTDTVETVSIVKGDSKSIAIASASIVAKVTRDRYMKRLSQIHPEYIWEKNKGYGTAEHCEAIKKFGITQWHRTLFVRSILQHAE